MNRFIEKIKKYDIGIVFFLIFLYVLVLTSFSFWKYYNFLYNGIDLAIFNQVFYNTSLGRLFQMSIHPQSYLGDHFEPFILFLTPIYYLFKSPLTLLFLQSLFLGLTAWPAYLIAKKVFKDIKNSYLYSLLIVCIVLLNPIYWNINLFDFHILPFAIFFLLFAFYYYLTRKFLLYILFIFIALTVREDVSLAVIMFGFLPFLNIKKAGEIKKSFVENFKWVVAPIIMAIFWFVLAMKVSSYFNPDSSYKFLVYYGWLSGSQGFLGLLQSIIGHPINVLLHVVSFSNLWMLFVLFLSFGFLPLFGKRYLCLCLIVFFQIALSSGSWGNLVTSTHYSTLFLPAFIIGSIYGLKNFLPWRENKIMVWKNETKKNKLIDFSEAYRAIVKDNNILIVLFVATIFFANLALGTSVGMTKALFDNNITIESDNISQLLDKIPNEASVVSSYRFLSNLSNREMIYSLHYGFFGKRQFSNDDYKFPDNIDYYIIDTNDFITYKLQSIDDSTKMNQYEEGSLRLERYLKNYELVDVVDSFLLFKKNTNDSGYEKLVSVSDKNEYNNIGYIFNNNISLLGYKLNESNLNFEDYIISPYSFLWKINSITDDNYELKLSVRDNNGDVIWNKYYPLGYGFAPTANWESNMIETSYWFLIPKSLLNHNYKKYISVVNITNGYAGLDSIRSAYNYIEDEYLIGEIILSE